MTGSRKARYWHKFVDEVFVDNLTSRQIADRLISHLQEISNSKANWRNAPTQRQVTSYLVISPKYEKIPYEYITNKGCKWRRKDE
tara:strand:+ start:2700 stop:2954 length:255 start_codon:yes stop_codon:yes gene_type:complete